MAESSKFIPGKPVPKVAIGLCVGPGLGMAAASLLGANISLGSGLGMLVGVTTGIFLDTEQPRRSRFALAIFTSMIVVAVLVKAVL